LRKLEDALALGTLTAFDAERGRELYEGNGPKRPERVVIEFDASRSTEASRVAWGDAQTTKSRRAGGTQVTFMCGDFAPVIARVLRFGAHARVVKPPALIALVVENLAAASATYKPTAPKRKRPA